MKWQILFQSLNWLNLVNNFFFNFSILGVRIFQDYYAQCRKDYRRLSKLIYHKRVKILIISVWLITILGLISEIQSFKPIGLRFWHWKKGTRVWFFLMKFLGLEKHKKGLKTDIFVISKNGSISRYFWRQIQKHFHDLNFFTFLCFVKFLLT